MKLPARLVVAPCTRWQYAYSDTPLPPPTAAAKGSDDTTTSAADRLRAGAAAARAERAKRDATTFTREQLREYDGTDGKRIYMGCLGDVFDVTPAKGFYGPGAAYGCFAGVDATRGLAMMKKHQRYIDDPRTDLLSSKQLKVAKDWHARFVKKYKKVGTLADEGAEEEQSSVAADSSSSEGPKAKL